MERGAEVGPESTIDSKATKEYSKDPLVILIESTQVVFAASVNSSGVCCIGCVRAVCALFVEVFLPNSYLELMPVGPTPSIAWGVMLTAG